MLGPFLGVLWSLSRLFLRAASGRQRFNVLGALDAVSHQLITFSNDGYINAEAVCALFYQIRQAFPHHPVSLVLDNARYQKCSAVFACAEQLGLELLYLPPYSPKLNLIERLWKFVKKYCLYSRYYPDFTSFKAAISECLAHTHDVHKPALASLLVPIFQLFKDGKVQVVPS